MQLRRICVAVALMSVVAACNSTPLDNIWPGCSTTLIGTTRSNSGNAWRSRLSTSTSLIVVPCLYVMMKRPSAETEPSPAPATAN